MFAQTTTPTPDQVKGWLDKLADFNDSFAGAPTGVLIFIFMLGLALALRAWHLFPNRYIGPLVLIIGILISAFGTPRGTLELRLWIIRNVLIGGIFSIIAYFTHRIISNRYPSLAEPGDTTFTPKPPTPPQP